MGDGFRKRRSTLHQLRGPRTAARTAEDALELPQTGAALKVAELFVGTGLAAGSAAE